MKKIPTDNEIVNVLEICGDALPCRYCPRYDKETEKCTGVETTEILKLIFLQELKNRELRAEIDELKKMLLKQHESHILNRFMRQE